MNKEILGAQQKYLADKFKGTTVAVSGSTGLIGSRIVKYLLSLNDIYDSQISVVALYRSLDKYNRIYSEYKGRTDLTAVFFDTNTVIESVTHTDYCVHCAGISGGTKMHLKDPCKVFEIAYEGTKQILDLCVRSGCKKYCYVSTYEIYGTPDDGHKISETEPCPLNTMELRNIYSECKRMCESMAVAYNAKCGLDVVCGRLTSTFGYGVKYDDPRFFAEFARCAVEKRDIVLKSKGGTVRSYLDSDDAATAFLYLLANGENCNVYNVTNMDNNISIKDIAQKIIKLSGENIELKFDIAEDVKALGFRKEGCSLMDASKLYGIGWKPVYNMDETILKLLEELRAKKG